MKLVRKGGGLSVSFNGDREAVRNAELAARAFFLIVMFL